MKKENIEPSSPAARLKEIRDFLGDDSGVVYGRTESYSAGEHRGIKTSLSWFRWLLNDVINGFDKKKSNYSGAEVRRILRKRLREVESGQE